MHRYSRSLPHNCRGARALSPRSFAQDNSGAEIRKVHFETSCNETAHTAFRSRQGGTSIRSGTAHRRKSSKKLSKLTRSAPSLIGALRVALLYNCAHCRCLRPIFRRALLPSRSGERARCQNAARARLYRCSYGDVSRLRQASASSARSGLSAEDGGSGRALSGR